MSQKLMVGLLILLSVIVLPGQIWLEGVPPFAIIVNILFLSLSLLIF